MAETGDYGFSDTTAPGVERQNLLRVSGDGVFATLQGEGISAGRPSVFLRLQECNLHCGRDGVGWRCDTPYTWDRSLEAYWTEPRGASIKSLSDEIVSSWENQIDAIEMGPNLVVSGGEPLLQQAGIIKLIASLPSNWHVEIETNGTIVPKASLKNVQFNCSPKLTSSGNDLRARRRPQALQAIAAMPDSWFKFVVARPQDADEIREVMAIANGGDFGRVILMAEGVSVEKLNRNEDLVASIARELGCMAGARNHIYWYGDKRRT